MPSGAVEAWASIHREMLKCRCAGDTEAAQRWCLLAAAEMWELGSGGKTNGTSSTRGESVGEHLSASLQPGWTCSPVILQL